MIGGAEIQNQMITRKLDTVLALESNFSNRLCLFEIANEFVTNMLPENMTYVLRMVWSMGQGGNDSVMQNQEGTDLSSTGEYIEKLVSRSFSTFGDLLGLNEVRPLHGGACRSGGVSLLDVSGP